MNATIEKQYIPITECAKIIREELKKAFPDTKFSVRSSKYSMGSHVNVSYDDGPPSKGVDLAIGWISGRTFDGSDDSTHYHDTLYNGKQVSFAGSRPSVSRHISNSELRLQAIKAVLQERMIYRDWQSPYKIDQDASHILHSIDMRWETIERAVERFCHTGYRS